MPFFRQLARPHPEDSNSRINHEKFVLADNHRYTEDRPYHGPGWSVPAPPARLYPISSTTSRNSSTCCQAWGVSHYRFTKRLSKKGSIAGRRLRAALVQAADWAVEVRVIIEPCTANDWRAANGSPDAQAPAGITRSLAMQTSMVAPRSRLRMPNRWIDTREQWLHASDGSRNGSCARIGAEIQRAAQ